MSAYIVNLDVIDVLASVACRPAPHGSGLSWTWPDPSQEYGYGYRLASFDGQDEVGRMLLRENERSIMYRYPDTATPEGAPIFDRMPGPIDYAGADAYAFPVSSFPMPDPVHVLKILACFEYQACEHPAWRDSEAYGFCRSITNRLHAMLPGYNTGPWDYQHPAPVRRPEGVTA